VGNRNFVVGMFVTFAVAALVVVTLWLSGQRGNQETVTYSLYFERDVSGLMLGGPVYYLGVEVGNVTRTEIVAGDPISIRVDIEVLASTPIDTGTWASLYYQGITGVAVINLSGDPGMNLPLKRAPDQEFPVIEVRDAGLAAVLADAPIIMQKLDKLLDRAAGMMGEKNSKLVSDTLSNLETLSGSLAEKDEVFTELPGKINAALAEFESSLKLVQSTIGEMRPGIRNTLDQLAQASHSLAEVTDRLDQWTTANGGDVEDFLGGGLGQVSELVTDTRAALRELEKLLQSLREDPSRLIYRPADPAKDSE
jgi:phospholipid/cholesterol/gamma-HCH transport system substrate-binding protein